MSKEDRKLFGNLLNQALVKTKNQYKQERFNKEIAKYLVEYCFNELNHDFLNILIQKTDQIDSNKYKIEYVSLCDAEYGQVFGTQWSKKKFEEAKQEIEENGNTDKVLSLVVRVGGTRLLDNIVLKNQN